MVGFVSSLRAGIDSRSCFWIRQTAALPPAVSVPVIVRMTLRPSMILWPAEVLSALVLRLRIEPLLRPVKVLPPAIEVLLVAELRLWPVEVLPVLELVLWPRIESLLRPVKVLRRAIKVLLPAIKVLLVAELLRLPLVEALPITECVLLPMTIEVLLPRVEILPPVVEVLLPPRCRVEVRVLKIRPAMELTVLVEALRMPIRTAAEIRPRPVPVETSEVPVVEHRAAARNVTPMTVIDLMTPPVRTPVPPAPAPVREGNNRDAHSKTDRQSAKVHPRRWRRIVLLCYKVDSLILIFLALATVRRYVEGHEPPANGFLSPTGSSASLSGRFDPGSWACGSHSPDRELHQGPHAADRA